MIDSQFCDLGEKVILIPIFDGQSMSDVEALRQGRAIKIDIPYTSRNEQIMLSASDPHATQRFNDHYHSAQLKSDSSTLFEGGVRLLALREHGYQIEIREGAGQWAHDAAQRELKQLAIPFSMRLTPVDICDGWSDSSAVKFMPVIRDQYPQQNSSTDLLPAERLLSVDDYHPFLHVATMVESIFAQSGYRIRSRFFDTEFFRSLYMSGAYSSRDTTALANRMEFVARRRGDVTAQASSTGQLFADPSRQVNSLGNIVDTATPQSLDVDGVPIEGLCNNSGCFVVESGRIGFRPTAEVSVAFEIYLKYTTDHRILSRERLRGVDSIWLGPGDDLKFGLANRYEDRRSNLSTNHSYRVVVFDHQVGTQYRICYTLNSNLGQEWVRFNARSAKIITPLSGAPRDPYLEILMGSQWRRYTQDWALYDGYIEETGRTTVEVRFQTTAQVVAAGALKRFDTIQFSGGESGMSFTLHRQSSMRARFTSSPGYNAQINFADVSQNRIRQLDLLASLQHLFNLRFFTEQPTRTVWIEPYDDFYDPAQVVDWRHKSDFLHPVEFFELAPEVHKTRTWGYMSGDGAVDRFDAQNSEPFGQWSFDSVSYATLMGEKIERNPLFCPTISSQGHYSNAPSARLLLVGNRDLVEDDGSNFIPRIVRFCGLKPLPAGERWGYPTSVGLYPLAAFHLSPNGAEQGFTLCFEDRDQLDGLHRFYDRQVACEATRQRITLTIGLAAHEYESLFAPQNGVADLRSVYRIATGRGEIRATIESVGEYDPDAKSVKCTFIRQIEN